MVGTVMLFLSLAANGQTTNGLSEAEIQGRLLAQKILEQWPAENSTNTGIIQIRNDSGLTEVPVKCTTLVTPAGWRQLYQSGSTHQPVTLLVVHDLSQPNTYFFSTNISDPVPLSGDLPTLARIFGRPNISGAELATPFAGSDFWLGDLGLEFFHWPQQKVLPKTTNLKRGRSYTLLESTNPDPPRNGYARVLSWIDNESNGILEAEAYDASGKELKNFEPKDLQKINGHYEVQSLIMDNLQTGSRSRLEFNLDH